MIGPRFQGGLKVDQSVVELGEVKGDAAELRQSIGIVRLALGSLAISQESRLKLAARTEQVARISMGLRKKGPGLYGPLIAVERIIQLALRFVNLGHAIMSPGQERPASQSRLIDCQGLVHFSLSPQRVAQIQIELSKIRLQAQSLLVARDGFIGPIEDFQCSGQMNQRF